MNARRLPRSPAILPITPPGWSQSPIMGGLEMGEQQPESAGVMSHISCNSFIKKPVQILLIYSTLCKQFKEFDKETIQGVINADPSKLLCIKPLLPPVWSRPSHHPQVPSVSRPSSHSVLVILRRWSRPVSHQPTLQISLPSSHWPPFLTLASHWLTAKQN